MMTSTASRAEVQPSRALTIDELAAATGVPSRTIRFYQSQGALPAPERRGRIAVYTSEHVDRLRLIDTLQRRGLRLAAIADLVTRGGRTGLSVREWIGLDDRLSVPWSEDHPATWDTGELLERIAPRGADRLPDLERALLLVPDGAGRWDVPSPALLDIALRLEDAGIELPTASRAAGILRRHLVAAVDELVRHFTEHAGRGFGRRLDPDELVTALEAIRPLGVEAVRVTFAQEMERALRSLLP